MSNGILRIANREISYDDAKGMLFPELISQKGNEAVLAEHPHEKVEDMAILFRLDLHSEDGLMMSARVNQGMMEAFGVSAEQLKQDTLENAPITHPATFRSMEEVLSAMMGGMPMPEPPEGAARLYVASTESMNRGAGVLAYPGFLQEASEKIGGNFFVLPSSIHELLFLKDNGDMSRQELAGIVRSVNATEVSPQEQLSDNVYHYDSQARVFELAEKYEARRSDRQAERPSVLGTLGKAKEAQKDLPVKAKVAKAHEAVI